MFWPSGPPKFPQEFLDSQYVFLANTHPALQLEMLGKLKSAKLSWPIR